MSKPKIIAIEHDDYEARHIGQLPDGRQTQVPLMPITMGGRRPGVRSSPPRLGEHTDALLLQAGYTADQIRQLKNNQAAG